MKAFAEFVPRACMHSMDRCGHDTDMFHRFQVCRLEVFIRCPIALGCIRLLSGGSTMLLRFRVSLLKGD